MFMYILTCLENKTRIKLAQGVPAKARPGAKYFKWTTFVKHFGASDIEKVNSNVFKSFSINISNLRGMPA